MDKIFPSMNSKPEKIQIFSIIPCWVWVFILLPMFMPFIGLGLWTQSQYSVWLDIAYHICNFVLMMFIISRYLKDEWEMVIIDTGFYVKHILLTVGLIVLTELALLGSLFRLGFDIGYMVESLPVSEMSVCHTPLALIDNQPIFGTIALSLFAPFSICTLFYCLGFAPICYNRPWLAYLCIAVITIIPPVINIIWRGEADFELNGYIAQLPIHLLACWSYQKTDNVWTPIISLALANLILSVGLQIFYLG